MDSNSSLEVRSDQQGAFMPAYTAPRPVLCEPKLFRNDTAKPVKERTPQERHLRFKKLCETTPFYNEKVVKTSRMLLFKMPLRPSVFILGELLEI